MCQIRSLEQRGYRINRPHSRCQRCDLSLPLAERILKKKACLFVFDCPNDNVCSPFKSYVNFLNHDFNATLLGNQTFIYGSSPCEYHIT